MSSEHDYPKVSILINCYNYGQYVGEAIASAIGQSYPNLEVIVVDDGSTDNSVEVAKTFGDQIKLVTKSNGGQNSAVNAGVAASTGSVLCLLDADDIFFSHKAATVVRSMKELGMLGKPFMLYHRAAMINDNGEPIHPDLIKARIGSLIRDLYIWPKYDHLSNPKEVLVYTQKEGVDPDISNWPPSYFCMTRELAEILFPLPEGACKIYADIYINRAAGFFAPRINLRRKLSSYRIHHANNHANTGAEYFFEGQTHPWPQEVAEDIVMYINRLLESHGLSRSLKTLTRHKSSS